MENKGLNTRIALDKASKRLFSLSTVFALMVLGILIYRILVQGYGWLDYGFLTNNLSISPAKAGIRGVIIGSVLLMAVVAPVSLVLGVATAIYLEEYSSKGKLHSLIKTNISNLAGVPSVIFGLLGLTVFSRLLKLGSSVLAGGLTMSLLVLPIVVVASQEAIRAVPGFLRDASYAMDNHKKSSSSRISAGNSDRFDTCAFKGYRRNSTPCCFGHPSTDSKNTKRYNG